MEFVLEIIFAALSGIKGKAKAFIWLIVAVLFLITILWVGSQVLQVGKLKTDIQALESKLDAQRAQCSIDTAFEILSQKRRSTTNQLKDLQDEKTYTDTVTDYILK